MVEPQFGLRQATLRGPCSLSLPPQRRSYLSPPAPAWAVPHAGSHSSEASDTTSCLGNRCSCRRDDSGGAKRWNAEWAQLTGEQGRGLGWGGGAGRPPPASVLLTRPFLPLHWIQPPLFVSVWFPVSSSGFGVPGSPDYLFLSSYLFSVPPQLGKRNKGPGVWARGNTCRIWCTGPVGVGPTALLPQGL